MSEKGKKKHWPARNVSTVANVCVCNSHRRVLVRLCTCLVFVDVCVCTCALYEVVSFVVGRRRSRRRLLMDGTTIAEHHWNVKSKIEYYKKISYACACVWECVCLCWCVWPVAAGLRQCVGSYDSHTRDEYFVCCVVRRRVCSEHFCACNGEEVGDVTMTTMTMVEVCAYSPHPHSSV